MNSLILAKPVNVLLYTNMYVAELGASLNSLILTKPVFLSSCIISLYMTREGRKFLSPNGQDITELESHDWSSATLTTQPA